MHVARPPAIRITSRTAYVGAAFRLPPADGQLRDTTEVPTVANGHADHHDHSHDRTISHTNSTDAHPPADDRSNSADSPTACAGAAFRRPSPVDHADGHANTAAEANAPSDGNTDDDGGSNNRSFNSRRPNTSAHFFTRGRVAREIESLGGRVVHGNGPASIQGTCFLLAGAAPSG